MDSVCYEIYERIVQNLDVVSVFKFSLCCKWLQNCGTFFASQNFTTWEKSYLKLNLQYNSLKQKAFFHRKFEISRQFLYDYVFDERTGFIFLFERVKMNPLTQKSYVLIQWGSILNLTFFLTKIVTLSGNFKDGSHIQKSLFDLPANFTLNKKMTTYLLLRILDTSGNQNTIVIDCTNLFEIEIKSQTFQQIFDLPCNFENIITSRSTCQTDLYFELNSIVFQSNGIKTRPFYTLKKCEKPICIYQNRWLMINQSSSQYLIDVISGNQFDNLNHRFHRFIALSDDGGVFFGGHHTDIKPIHLNQHGIMHQGVDCINCFQNSLHCHSFFDLSKKFLLIAGCAEQKFKKCKIQFSEEPNPIL